MTSPASDPRVFFAAERTLLAWLRTGLTLMGIGFVVSRFGLFLRLLAHETADVPAPHGGLLSAALGVGFVLAGTAAILAATIQHQRFVATLPLLDLPPRYSRGLALGLSFGVALLGLALSAYLAFAAR